MFTRQPYTIPASGEFLKIDAKGMAVIIENMPIYDTPEDVPTFHYNSRSGRGQAMFPLSTYGYDPCEEFRSIYLQGTDESAGDTVWLWINDQYLETKINIVFTSQFEGEPGVTSEETLSDAVFQFNELAIVNGDGKLPKAVYLAAQTDDIRYAFGVTPEQAGAGDLGYDLLKPAATKRNEPIKIEGINFILALRFINKTNLTDSTLIYTFEY